MDFAPEALQEVLAGHRRQDQALEQPEGQPAHPQQEQVRDHPLRPPLLLPEGHRPQEQVVELVLRPLRPPELVEGHRQQEQALERPEEQRGHQRLEPPLLAEGQSHLGQALVRRRQLPELVEARPLRQRGVAKQRDLQPAHPQQGQVLQAPQGEPEGQPGQGLPQQVLEEQVGHQLPLRALEGRPEQLEVVVSFQSPLRK